MILFFCSFLIVAFGQPLWLEGGVASCSAAVGYALFWHQHRGGFWKGTGWFTAVQLIQLFWMTSIEFQGIYILFVYLGIALWLGVQFGILNFFVKEKMGIVYIGTLASCWTLLEWGRMHLLCGFSFNPVGLALTSSIYSLQAAAIFGILGLSFWVIFVNLVCVEKRYYLWIFCALAPYLFGGVHLAMHSATSGETISVALVQTGLLPSEKTPLKGKRESFISPYEQWRRAIHYLKEEGLTQWDLIVFPESAFPFPSDALSYEGDIACQVLSLEGIEAPHLKGGKISNEHWMRALAEHFSSHVVAGLDGIDRKRQLNHAAGYHVAPGVEEPNRYEKRILVPLAEYLPFAFLKPWVAFYGVEEFFTPGIEAKVFSGPVPFSLSICYEETFPALMREGRLKGAKLFVNLTNDNWYPDSILPLQHFSLARLRAVENGVPLIRACNSGVTAVVDSLGRITALFNKKAGVLSAQVAIDSHATPYTYWGDAGIIAVCLVFCVILVPIDYQEKNSLLKKRSVS